MSTSLCPEKASHVLKQVAGDSSAVWKPNHVILRNIKILAASSTRLALFCHPALHRASQGADTGFANSDVSFGDAAWSCTSQDVPRTRTHGTEGTNSSSTGFTVWDTECSDRSLPKLDCQ